jgi:hypothetical protein
MRYLPGPIETVSSGAAVITAYAAMALAQKYALPLEVAAAVVATAVSTGRRLCRFLAERMPDTRPKTKRPRP